MLYMFLTLAASKTKKEREESLNLGGGGGINKAYIVIHFLRACLGGDKRAAV